MSVHQCLSKLIALVSRSAEHGEADVGTVALTPAPLMGYDAGLFASGS
jgi:hypothetical protein